MKYFNKNSKRNVTMKDDFFADEEIPFYKDFNDKKDNKREQKEKLKKERRENFKELFVLNQIKKTKFSLGYILLICICFIMFLLSIIFMKISYVISFLFLDFLSFLSWNKLENLFENIHTDDLIYENFRNMENAFFKTNKLSTIYKNSETLCYISYILLNIALVISILANLSLSTYIPYFSEYIIVPILLFLNIIVLHISLIKDNVKLKLNICKYNVVFILTFILLLIEVLVSTLYFKNLNLNLNLIFILIIVNTLYIYLKKINKNTIIE